jgi:hypothetical protein
VRPTRRSLLALLGGAAAAAAIGRARALPAVPDTPVAIEVRAYPIDVFSIRERERKSVGLLVFRSGLELQSRYEGFGGFSGMWRSPDGGDLVAITDNAQWLTGKVVSRNGRLAGLADTLMAPVLGPNGRPLRQTRSYDLESLAIVAGTAYVGIERTQEVMRFDFANHGVLGRGQPVSIPAGVKEWPRNKGIEAIAVAPPRTPLGGALVIVAERARWEDGAPTQGCILTGPHRGAFDLARSDDYEVTDIAFLPDGDLLILERRFSLLSGVAARLRRIPAGALRPGAILDGPVIFEADASSPIDNMEGLALHRSASGETIVTLISDNNFSVLQRTLLLEFALAED